MKNIINSLQSGFDRLIGVSEWFDAIFPSFIGECCCMQDNCQPEACCCCQDCCC